VFNFYQVRFVVVSRQLLDHPKKKISPVRLCGVIEVWDARQNDTTSSVSRTINVIIIITYLNEIPASVYSGT